MHKIFAANGLLLSLGVTALVTLYSFFAQLGYSVFTSDQLLYFPYMFRSLHPGALPHDFMAQTTPALFSFFNGTIVALVQSSGLDLFWVLFLLTVLTRFFFYYAIYRIVRYFTDDNLFALFSLLFVAYGFIVYGTGMRSMTNMLIARDMAAAFSLFSLSFLLRSRVLPASFFLGVGALFNVSTVVPFALVLYGVYAYRYIISKVKPSAFELVSLLLPGFSVVALWILAPEGGMGGLFTVLDEEWREILMRRVSVIFVSTWYYPNSSPLYIAVSVFFYFLIRRELPDIFSDREKRKHLNFIFFVPVGLVLFSMLAADYLGSAFVAQLQLGRSLILWKLILSPLFAYYAYRYIRDNPKDVLYNFSLLGILASFIVSEKVMFVFLPLQIILWVWRRTNIGAILRVPLSWVRVISLAALLAAFPILVWVSKLHDTRRFLDLVPEIASAALLGALTVWYMGKLSSLKVLVPLMVLVLLSGMALNVSSLSIYPRELGNKDFMEACNWVQENTDTNALFMTEPFSETGGALRLVCLRNVFATKKDGGVGMFNRNFAIEWWKRLGLINAMRENQAVLKDVAQDYGVNYVFADAAVELPYQKAFENERFRIYKLK